MSEEQLIKDLWCFVAIEAFVILGLLFGLLVCRSTIKEKDRDISGWSAEKRLETKRVIELQASERQLKERLHRAEWYIINTLSRAGVGKLDAATYADRVLSGEVEKAERDKPNLRRRGVRDFKSVNGGEK